MSLVKLDLAALSLMEKVQFAARVGDALINNEPTFPECPVAGADFMDLAFRLRDAAASAESARAAVRENVDLQAGFEAELDVAFMQIARYVQNVSGGDEATIAVAGLTVRNRPSPTGRLPMPRDLRVWNGPGAGELLLRWKALRGAKSYCVEQRANEASPNAWTLATTSTKAKATVKGLMSGRKYWFRVAAIGSAGQGAWSESVGMVAG